MGEGEGLEGWGGKRGSGLGMEWVKGVGEGWNLEGVERGLRI